MDRNGLAVRVHCFACEEHAVSYRLGDAIVAASETSDGFPLVVVIVFLVVDIAAW